LNKHHCWGVAFQMAMHAGQASQPCCRGSGALMTSMD
jgi:hypothetical protein